MKINSDKVLLKRLTEKSIGGILLPQYGVQAPYSLYEVIQVGPGFRAKFTNKIVPNEIRPGMRVLANCGVAREVNLMVNGEKEKYYLLPNAEECAIILDDDEDI